MSNLDDHRLEPDRVPYLPEHDRSALDAIADMTVDHLIGGLDETPCEGLALMYDTGTHQQRTPDMEAWNQLRGTLIIGTYLGAAVDVRWLPVRERWDPTRYDNLGHPGAFVADYARGQDPDQVGTDMAEHLPGLARQTVINSMTRDATFLRELLDDYAAGDPTSADKIKHYFDPPCESELRARQLIENTHMRHRTFLDSLT